MGKADLYTRITNRIIAELEAGTRPWLKPWNAEHAAGRITRPLRHNGIPYRGINVVTLWMTATARGFACPIWLTYKQAQELGAQVRKGEHGELVVYANRITRTETAATGEETEREIPFLKGYTVFNAEQIDNRDHMRPCGPGPPCGRHHLREMGYSKKKDTPLAAARKIALYRLSCYPGPAAMSKPRRYFPPSPLNVRFLRIVDFFAAAKSADVIRNS